MTASRKDYVAVARAIREELDGTDPRDLRDRATIRVVAYAVAEAFASTSGYTPNGNRSFDSDRFLKACGVES